MLHKSKLFQNILSLSTAEFINKLMMYFYLAYLAHHIGTVGIGSIALGQSIANFCFMALQIGFDSVGTREIARNKDKMESFVNSVMTIRLLIALILFTIIAIYILSSDKTLEIKIVVLITCLNIFSLAGLLNWIFIALENMKIIAIRLIITSSLTLIGIVSLIHNEKDIILSASIMSGAIFVNSVWLWIYYQRKYHKIRLSFNFSFAKIFLKDTSPITLAFLFVAISQNIGILIIENTRHSTYLYDIAIFNAAYKFMTLSLVPSYIFQQSFYARFANAIDLQSKNEILKKYASITFIFGVFAALTNYFYADNFIQILWGVKFAESTEILKILTLPLIMIYLNVTYSTPLIAWNRERDTLRAVGFGSIFNVLTGLIFIPKYGAYAVAFSFIANELITLILHIYFIIKSKVQSYLLLFFKILVLGMVSFSILFFKNFYDFKFSFFIYLPLSLVIFVLLLHFTKVFGLKDLSTITKQ